MRARDAGREEERAMAIRRDVLLLEGAPLGDDSGVLEE